MTSNWGAWLAASSFVSQGFGHYLNALTGAPPKISAVLLLIGLGIVNIAGIQFSVKFQVGVICTVITVLIGFFILGIRQVDLSYFQPYSPYCFSGILEAALVGFLSIIGWDAIVASGEEIRNPKKSARALGHRRKEVD
ncbi:amino acid permease [Bacillota bacterium Lsc_1132]